MVWSRDTSSTDHQPRRRKRTQRRRLRLTAGPTGAEGDNGRGRASGWRLVDRPGTERRASGTSRPTTLKETVVGCVAACSVDRIPERPPERPKRKGGAYRRTGPGGRYRGALRPRFGARAPSIDKKGAGEAPFLAPLQSRCNPISEIWSGRLDSDQRPSVPNRVLYQAEPRPDNLLRLSDRRPVQQDLSYDDRAGVGASSGNSSRYFSASWAVMSGCSGVIEI